jgi:beta-glucanase (GH16 family)
MAPLAGHGIMRRWIVSGAVAIVLLALPAAASAGTSKAHTASKTATSILHTTVPAKGKYLLVVWVRSRSKHSRLVDVYLHGQKVRTVVANPWWGAAVYYTLTLSPTKLTVRTVNAPPAVQVRATLSLKKSAAPTPPTSTSNTAPPASSTSTTTTTTTTTTPVTTTTPPSSPSTAPYTSLAFSDNFEQDFTNGGSVPNQLPNSTDWNLDNWGSCGGGTLSESNTNDPGTSSTNLDGFNPSQSAYLTSSGLAITAVRNPSAPLGAANSYISAQVDSLGPSKESDQYGEVEASIYMPTAQGLCPGFWMLGDNNIAGSNIPGEIDVVEAPTFGDGPGSSADYFDLHGTSVGGTTQQFQSQIPLVSAGFHTYAIIWTPTSITWEIDGTAYAYASQAALVAGASWANDYSYGRFHLILDLAVGGWSCDFGECGPASAEAAPSYTMYVQWVKWLKLPS